MNIGILYPRSKAHPGITQDFIDGLKTFIRHAELEKDISLFSEAIGLGGSEKEVYEKAEKLLSLENVDILVAFIDLRVLAMLEPLFYSSGKLVIIVNAGANYPQNWVPKPNMIFLTLQHAFLCQLTGLQAGASSNARAAMVTTFYDCGYLHTAAMVKAFSKAGGAISFNHINKQAYDEHFSISELETFLNKDQETKALLCIMDELPASLFYDRLNESTDAAGLALYVSPMMLQDKAVEKLSSGAAFSVEGYLPWLTTSTNQANIGFIDHYSSQTKRQPGIFALLGWETGLILQQVFASGNKAYGDGAALAEALKKTDIPGPRGLLKLDPATNFYISPAVKCTVRVNAGKMECEENIDLEKEWEAFTKEPNDGVSSGWTNTYLCY